MSISKKIFYHSSNSYLLIITAVVMLLGITGCDACTPNTGDQLATDLHVTLTPSLLHGAQREAVLTVHTKGSDNIVARYKDFKIKLEVSGVGKNLGESKITFTGYDKSSKQVQRNIKLANQGLQPLEGSLYDYFKGGESGTLEYTQPEEVKFYFKPDMTSDVESIEIKITVTNNETHDVVFNDTSKWERSSPYEIKIIGLDQNGLIQNNTCTLQVTSKNPQVPITVDDLYDLEVGVTQDHNDPTDPHLNEVEDKAGEKIISFYSHELKDGKITKQLTVNAGPGKKKTTFTFALYTGEDENGNEATAVARAKYQPVVIPYTLPLTNNKLIGPSNKNFDISIQDAEGRELKPDELQKLKLKVHRKVGQAAKVDIDTGGGEDFEFEFKDANVLTLSGDNKTATKTLTLNTDKDLQAAFECELVDSEGKVVADQQLSIQWEIGIEAIINYDNAKEEFQCKFQNKTNQDINQLKLAWEGLEGTTLKVAGTTAGNKMIDIPATQTKSEDLKVNWPVVGGPHQAKFKMTVATADGVMIYQKEHLIASSNHAPHLSISLEGAQISYKVDDIVQLKIQADEKVDENGLKIAKLTYKSSNNAALTISGQDVQSKNLQDLLELAGKGKLTELTKNAFHTIDLTIDPQGDLSGGSLTELKLDGSYYDSTAVKLPEIKIGWVGKLGMAMKPAENEVIDNGTLVANGEKEFKIVFTNNGEFPLDKERLEELELKIISGDVSKSPDKVLYKLNKAVDLATNSVTLWQIVKGQFKQGEDQKIEVAFTIEPGVKNLIEFTVQLVGKGAFANFDSKQGVKWMSVGKLVITTQSPIIVTPKSSGNELEDFSFEIQNNGPDLSAEDLKKIVVDFLSGDKKQRAMGTTRKIGKKKGLTYRTIAFTTIDPSSSSKVQAIAARYQQLIDDENNKGQITLYNLLELNFGNVQGIRNGEKITVPLKNIPISSSGASGKDKLISARLCLKDSTNMKVITEVDIREKTK
jgi:hypothetical protein